MERVESSGIILNISSFFDNYIFPKQIIDVCGSTVSLWLNMQNIRQPKKQIKKPSITFAVDPLSLSEATWKCVLDFCF